jgi:hypothetical protein
LRGLGGTPPGPRHFKRLSSPAKADDPVIPVIELKLRRLRPDVSCGVLDGALSRAMTTTSESHLLVRLDHAPAVVARLA